MALNYSTNQTFSGRITPADTNYPYGSSINESAPGANDGTQYIKQRADDILGFQQALLTEADLTPNGSSDTALNSQYLNAAKRLFKTGRRNLVGNGEFRLWDYGTSFVADDMFPAPGLNTANSFLVDVNRGTALIDRAPATVFTTFHDDIKYGFRVRPQAGSRLIRILSLLRSSDSYDLVGDDVTVSFIVNSNESFNLKVQYRTHFVPDQFNTWEVKGSETVPISIGDNKIQVTFNDIYQNAVNAVTFLLELEDGTFTPGFLDISLGLFQVEKGEVATVYDYKTIGEDRVNSAEFETFINNYQKKSFDYFIQPDGLIIQKGNVGVRPGGNSTITFPIAFPNAAIQIVDTIQQGLGIFEYHGNLALGAGTLSKTGCVVHNGDTTYGGTYSYIVIGY